MTNVKEIVKSCDKMIGACGKFPRNVALSKYHHFLGKEWGTVFREYYTGHPKARLMVRDGFEMAVPVLENTIKELNELTEHEESRTSECKSPDPSQSSPAS